MLEFFAIGRVAQRQSRGLIMCLHCGRLHLGIRSCSGIFLSVCPIAVPASRFALPRVGVPAFRLTTRSEFSRNEE